MPQQFKSSVITPLLKKPGLDPNVMNNYRPVSNLPYLAKLVERIVAKRLLHFVESHGLFEPFQSAYRPFHSTETAMLRVQHDLLMASERQETSALVLLDLSAAFDTLEHATLLRRLTSIGLADSALMWMTSYLSNRYQSVRVGSSQSSAVPVTTGVPQGSVLGPLLFTLFTRELGEVIRKRGFQCHFYADDTQIYASFPANETQKFVSRLELCLSDVMEWMRSSCLCLNEDKTEILLVGTAAQLRKVVFPSLKVGTTEILPTSTARVLGVSLDSKMKMDSHIKASCRSAWFYLRSLSRIRPCLPRKTCEILIHSFVTSRIDACNALLAGAMKGELNRLQRVLNAAARLLTLAEKQCPITPILRELHWLRVEERIKYKIALLTFKALQGNSPGYLQNLVAVQETPRRLRSSSELLLQQPFVRLVSTDAAFGVAAPKVWNSLPVVVRSAHSLASFKSLLKTHLFMSSFSK
jgi:hypothetical protein